MSNSRKLSALQIVDLEQIAADRFRSKYNLSNMSDVTFGGQLLALALRAAQKTGVAWPTHSCVGYFLKKAPIAEPIEFEVERTRDGRRFAMRHVVGRQNGVPVFDLMCSFHAEQSGLSHQVSVMGTPPPPEGVPLLSDFLRTRANWVGGSSIARALETYPIETRLINPEAYFTGKGDVSDLSFWLRVPSAEGIENPEINACLLALLSDWWIGGTPLMQHQSSRTEPRSLRVLTINHSMWFHGPVSVGDWLLYRATSPWANNGRGLVSGAIFNRSGTAVATVTQELAMFPIAA